MNSSVQGYLSERGFTNVDHNIDGSGQNVPGELLIMTIDLGGEKEETIRVMDNDNPKLLAQLFCQMHQLEDHIVPIIEKNIQDNIELVLKQRQGLESTIQNGTALNQTTSQSNDDDQEESNIISKSVNKYDGIKNDNPKFYTDSKKPKSYDLPAYIQPTKFQDIKQFTPQINRKSLAMMKDRSRESSTPVYNRLYNIATEKKKKQEEDIIKSIQKEQERPMVRNKSFDNSRQSVDNLNNGDMLYMRGLMFQERAQQKRDQIRNANSQQEVQECKFKPFINPLSRVIAQKVKHEQSQDEYTQNQAYIREKNLDELRAQSYQKEQMECSFKPQINKVSQFIVDKQSQDNKTPQKRYNSLYNNAKEIKQRVNSKGQKIYSEICSFKPQINENSRQIFKDQDFFTRQKKFLENKKDNLSLQSFLLNQQIDFKNGQDFFNPVINKSRSKSKANNSTFVNDSPQNKTLNNNNSPVKPAYEKLYEQREQKKSQYVQKQLLIEQQECIDKSFRPVSKSEQLFNEKLQKSLQQIFKLMDSDNDGIIQAKSTDITKIPDNVLLLLAPFMIEMEKKKQTFNEASFTKVSFEMVLHMNAIDRSTILNFKGVTPVLSKAQPQFPFAPQLDKNSRKIASQKSLKDLQKYK